MEVRLDPIPDDGPLDLPMRSVLRRLEALAQRGSAVHWMEENQQAVRLTEVTWIPNAQQPTHACLLFTYGDIRGSDPSFGNLRTGTVRTEHKRLGEGNAVSAHLLIKTSFHTRNGRRYFDALLEDVPGIGKSKIQPAVTAFLKNTPAFRFRNSEGERQDCRPKFVLTAMNASELAVDVSGGVLKYFMLVKDIPNDALDEDGYTTQVQQTLKVKPVDDAEFVGQEPPTFLQKLLGVSRWAEEHDYDSVRVVYDRRDGKNRTITVGTHREDAEDFLIQKIEKITLATPMDQASETASVELRRKMHRLLPRGA